MPGIDGLRAIAVLAVLLYHADIPWMPGGFLGVDVFFVISGYLITSLLLLEWHREGHIGLTAFWARRLRRLLPALITVLIVTSTFATLFARDAVYRLAADVTAALTYSTNWFLIFRGESYFEAFARPPLLRHLWSLAVEEQFYLIWPLVFTAVVALVGSRRGFTRTTRIFLTMLVAAIVGSTVLMAAMFTPFDDPSRIYFGTDTRAHVILVGVLLAFVWQPWRFRGRLGSTGRTALTAIGLAALAGLGAILTLSSEYGAFLYRGGFLVTALVTAVIIAVTVHPQIAIGSALGFSALRWVGKRSYGIYLWHWPVYMVTRPGVDVPLDWSSDLSLRLVLTFALAEASYRFIEQPIRKQGFGVWIRSIVIPVRKAAPQVAVVMPAIAVVFLVGLAVGLISAHEEGPGAADLGAAGLEEFADARATTTTLAPPSASVPFAVTPTDVAPPLTTTTSASQAPTPNVQIPESGAYSVVFIGDSVMLGAAEELKNTFGNDTYIDATVSRQLRQVPQITNRLNALDLMADTVVLHVGTNGRFNSRQFDDLMDTLRGVDRVYFLTAHVPRRYVGSVNDALRSGVERWPNAHLLDWDAYVEANPTAVGSDSTHLTGAGRTAYAQFIKASIES